MSAPDDAELARLQAEAEAAEAALKLAQAKAALAAAQAEAAKREATSASDAASDASHVAGREEIRAPEDAVGASTPPERESPPEGESHPENRTTAGPLDAFAHPAQAVPLPRRARRSPAVGDGESVHGAANLSREPMIGLGEPSGSGGGCGSGSCGCGH